MPSCIALTFAPLALTCVRPSSDRFDQKAQPSKIITSSSHLFPNLRLTEMLGYPKYTVLEFCSAFLIR
jgi:hypothetical protein